MTNEQIERAIYRHHILLALLFVLGLPAYIISLVTLGRIRQYPLVVGLITLALALYYSYVCLKFIRKVKIEDKRFILNFSILLGATFGLYVASDLFILTFFKTTFTVMAISIFLLLLGYFGVLVIVFDKATRKRWKVKIKMRLNRQTLPLAVVDFILAGLMILLADLMGSMKVLMYLMGFLFLTVAVLSLIVKPYNL